MRRSCVFFLRFVLLLNLANHAKSCVATGGGGNPSTTCTATTPTIVAADPANGIQNFDPPNGVQNGDTLTFTCNSNGAFVEIDDGASTFTYVDTQNQGLAATAPGILTLTCSDNQWIFTSAQGDTDVVTTVRCLAP